jgi:hypothetical protein
MAESIWAHRTLAKGRPHAGQHGAKESWIWENIQALYNNLNNELQPKKCFFGKIFPPVCILRIPYQNQLVLRTLKNKFPHSGADKPDFCRIENFSCIKVI